MNMGLLDQYQQSKRLFQSRLLIMGSLCLAFVVFLSLSLFNLQIIQQERYTTLATKNRLRLLPIEPSRGLIFDRNGILLAKNLPAFSIEIIPSKTKSTKQTIKMLKEFITISDNEIDNFHKQLKQYRRFESVPLKIKLSDEEVAKFYVNAYRFPNVVIKAQMIRDYPLGKSMAHVVGYISRINESDLKTIDASNYSASHSIGKVGVEKFFEDTLHGEVGFQEVETDASNHIVRTISRTPPQSGDDLYLTIDSELQNVITDAMKPYRGAVVAIDPHNGEVLALVSAPSYDPNDFSSGISEEKFSLLMQAKDQPLFNRVLRGLYPPGSTIKPFITLAALKDHIITPMTQIFDPGKFDFAHHTYRDWLPGGHGWVNLAKAITVSCDTFFYDLATKISMKSMRETLLQFGFGETTHIELPGELKGVIPSPQWKHQHFHQGWYTGDTILSSIGQGFMLATPLQLASATASLANHGHKHAIHLLKRTISAEGIDFPNNFSESGVVKIDGMYWNNILAAMKSVVTKPYGTAHRIFANAPYTIAAKTGTSQVSNRRMSDYAISAIIPERLKPHSLFIAYAPNENPRIVLAVVIENSPGISARVSRQILNAYFKKHPTRFNEAEA